MADASEGVVLNFGDDHDIHLGDGFVRAMASHLFRVNVARVRIGLPWRPRWHQ